METGVEASSKELNSWIGRSETLRDTVGPTPVVALTATLDHPATPVDTGTALPPLWHWLYFLPMHRQSEIGPDGHAKRGGFLPPVPLPRRMWAGSRIEWHRPLSVGATATRRSRIVSVAPKRGQSGELVFVVVRHEISVAGGLALTEEHDIVYRGLEPAEQERRRTPPTPPAAWTRRI